jgi:hypothetical protein
MHAVILHAGGRIDAEDIGELAARSLAVWRSGGVVPAYVVLSLCDSGFQAMNKAAEFRKERRNQPRENAENTEGERG